MSWTKQQAKLFVKRTRDDWGAGWTLLGPMFQEALLAHEYVRVVSFQSTPALRSEDLAQLWRDMLHAAGLYTEDKP